MVSVPVRSPEPSFFVMLNVTVPFPLPVAPVTTVIHEAFDCAVHVQPAPAVTAMGGLVAGFLLKDLLVGLMEYEHAASWFTVNVAPAIVIVPVRAAPALTAEVKVTVPLPLPLVPDVIVSQDVAVDDVQAHPVPAVTATGVPAPPAPDAV